MQKRGPDREAYPIIAAEHARVYVRREFTGRGVVVAACGISAEPPSCPSSVRPLWGSSQAEPHSGLGTVLSSTEHRQNSRHFLCLLSGEVQ